jgi:hypothetical protein
VSSTASTLSSTAFSLPASSLLHLRGCIQELVCPLFTWTQLDLLGPWLFRKGMSSSCISTFALSPFWICLELPCRRWWYANNPCWLYQKLLF